jgi:hypothetical protein
LFKKSDNNNNMNFFLLSTILILFCKEYIIINHEIIIYSTFLSITIYSVYAFGFLIEIFDNQRVDIQNVLKVESSHEKNGLSKSIMIYHYMAHVPYYSDFYLNKNDDYHEPLLDRTNG